MRVVHVTGAKGPFELVKREMSEPGPGSVRVKVPVFGLIFGRRSIVGWPSGSSVDSEDTLAFSILSGVRPMTEVVPLERAAEGYERMMSGKARFRVVLTTG